MGHLLFILLVVVSTTLAQDPEIETVVPPTPAPEPTPPATEPPVKEDTTIVLPTTKLTVEETSTAAPATEAPPTAKPTIAPTCPCRCFNGRDGRDGVTVVGPAGLNGRDGIPGKDCVECRQGPEGPQGEKGENGTQGAPGEPGKQGPEGPAGEVGEPGAEGLPGKPGTCDPTEMENVKKEIEALKKQIAELKETGGTGGNVGPIAQSRLPAGYAEFSAYDLQWQSIHMAAAAACRGSTPGGGNGPIGNFVFPRVADLSCWEVCQRTGIYTACDAELSIIGFPRKVTKPTEGVGSFYNYGCGGKSRVNFEPMMNAEKITDITPYISYCCCKKP